MTAHTNEEPLPLAPAEVPVFDCRLIVSPADENGRVRVRCANLGGIDVTAGSERDALRQATAMFKERVAEASANRSAIAWIDPAESPLAEESLRWIPVHL